MKLIKIAYIGILSLALSFQGFSKPSGSSSSSSRSFSSSSSKSYSSPSRSSSSSTSPSRSFSSSSSSTAKSSPSSAKSYYTAPSTSSDSKPSSNTSSSSTTSSSSWFSKKPSTSTPQTSTRQVSNVDRARYESASKSGKVFQTRDVAVNDFKTKYSSQYTSKYSSEPTKRPDYIPTVYRQGSNTYNISYNQGAGGYGYYNALGTFMLYDLMMDNSNLNSVMARNNYYVGNLPQVTYVSNSHGFLFWFFSLAVIAGIIGMVFYLVNRLS